MINIITVIHILAALGVIGLVLIQHGKGADMGAAFGSGASGSLFGVSGSSNVLSKLTAVSVLVFFCTSLTLAYLASHRAGGGSVIKLAPATLDMKTDAKANVKKDATTKDLTTGETKTPESTPNVVTPANGNAAKDIPN